MKNMKKIWNKPTITQLGVSKTYGHKHWKGTEGTTASQQNYKTVTPAS